MVRFTATTKDDGGSDDSSSDDSTESADELIRGTVNGHEDEEWARLLEQLTD